MTTLCRPFLAFAVIALTGLAHAAAPSSVVSTEQVRAELLAHAPEGVAPGKPLWLGLRIEHQPHRRHRPRRRIGLRPEAGLTSSSSQMRPAKLWDYTG